MINTVSVSHLGNFCNKPVKTERLNHLSFINHQSVVCEVENYIQFNNYYRRHSTIGYLTPHQKYHELKNTA